MDADLPDEVQINLRFTGAGWDCAAPRSCVLGTPLSSDPDFRWETFCTECETCDANGWPTLADCVANAAEYFAGETV
jgi:hypothetical protein